MKNLKRSSIGRWVWASVFIILLSCFLPSIAQVYQMPETVLYETECYICGKTIQERREVESSYFDNMGQWMPMQYGYIKDSIKLQHIEIHKKIEVCPECLSKYGAEIKKYMEWMWNKKISELIAENIENRKKHSKLRHDNEVQDIELKIEKLQNKLRGKKSR